VPDLAGFPREDWAWAVREATREAPTAAFGYPEPAGPSRLREVLAGYLNRVRGAAADPGRIVTCTGFSQGLVLALQALAERGVTRVGFEDPGYDETGIIAAAAAGVAVVGENTLQDLRAKRALAPGLVFDFIGHLQRRKVKDVLPCVRLIHSLDSTRLAGEIARRAGGSVRVLVEVNVGEEPTKGGIVPGQLRAFVDDVSVHADLVIGGLMAMPPELADPERSRPHFARVRELAEGLAAEWEGRHDFRDLSMGTSQDFEVAAQEGATIVRLGTVLYGG
jgi:uncharacterized pyridoxal phosphate-containing UPF0001 family protein